MPDRAGPGRRSVTSPPPATRLARRLGTADAVFVGLGSMIGAGIFAAVAPAATAAGRGILLGLALAAAVAWLNAVSVMQLARRYPEAGGTYAYGRARLGDTWAVVAGAAYVAGKLASCAAIALTFGSYAAPASPRAARALAVGATLALTAINVRGVEKTATATRAMVLFVLATLAVAVVAALGGGNARLAHVVPAPGAIDAAGVLRAGGFLFFAFAGYARIATLGEEVRDPERAIPRAITLALALTLAIYACVVVASVAPLAPDTLAATTAPLADAVRQGRFGALAPVVRAGALVATLGVLLTLLAGVSRTVFAMAANGDLPRWLAGVHPTTRVPHRAELVVGALVAGTVAVADVRGAIGTSAVLVLLYYAIGHACAWTLAPPERTHPRALAALGLAGCALLALTLPAGSVLTAAGVLGAAVALRLSLGR